MKKINMKIWALCMALVGTFTACFEDDSIEGTPLADLTIGEFEGPITKTSFIGQKLEITPVVSGYDDSDLDYSWTITPVQNEYGREEYIQPEEISTDKNLSYEVNLSAGKYTIRLNARCKANDYTVSQEVTLQVVTQFSQGFYILKETVDGNTDLDLLAKDGSAFNENLLTYLLEDGAMKGTPKNLTIAYDHCYISTTTNQMTSGNLICVVSEEDDMKLFNSEDMQMLFNRSNLLYGGEMDADERSYGIFSGAWMNHYFTNKGTRSQYWSVMGGTSGKYGMLDAESGGSIYMANDKMNIFYWDETNHCVNRCDYNGTVTPVTDMFGSMIDLSMYNCLNAGTNMSGTPMFVFENRTTKERIIYKLSLMGTMDDYYTVDSGTNFAKGTNVCINRNQATIWYSVVANKLYSYDYNSGSERELPLNGIGSDETINYVTNQFMGSSRKEFDYLIVATTKGDNYNLYFYQMVGGVPDGEPVLKTSGTGEVSKVRYVSGSFSAWSYMLKVGFPLTD